MSPQANNPWTNPTHPTLKPAVTPAANQSHQRVYIPATANAQQQPPAPNNPWAYCQPPPQAWMPYPAICPMVVLTVPAIIPFASPPPMHYPGTPAVQFHHSPVVSPLPSDHYKGRTAAQVNADNQARAQRAGVPHPNVQMVPQVASPNTQYWCRELNGGYTLRSVNTIMRSLQPGEWKLGTAGHPYWVRHAPRA